MDRREIELPALPRRDSRVSPAAAEARTPPATDEDETDAGTPLVRRCTARACRGALGRHGERSRGGTRPLAFVLRTEPEEQEREGNRVGGWVSDKETEYKKT